jgi:hypothetical protein
VLAAKPSDRFETPCFAAGSRPLLLIQGGHAAAGCCARACAPSTAVDDASSRVMAKASRRARSWAEAIVRRTADQARSGRSLCRQRDRAPRDGGRMKAIVRVTAAGRSRLGEGRRAMRPGLDAWRSQSSRPVPAARRHKSASDRLPHRAETGHVAGDAQVAARAAERSSRRCVPARFSDSCRTSRPLRDKTQAYSDRRHGRATWVCFSLHSGAALGSDGDLCFERSRRCWGLRSCRRCMRTPTVGRTAAAASRRSSGSCGLAALSDRWSSC